MSIPLQFCDCNLVLLGGKTRMYNFCESRVRIVHPAATGEATRVGTLRKIGGGCHTLCRMDSNGESLGG